jgi:hypothetical protein
VFRPEVPPEVAVMLKFPFIAKTGLGGVLLPLPPHPMMEQQSIAIKPDMAVQETERSKRIDDSGMRPRDKSRRNGAPPTMYVPAVGRFKRQSAT